MERQSFDDLMPVNGSSEAPATTIDAIQDERERYLMIYAVILLAAILLYIARSVSYFKMCLRTSINLHDMLFRAITRVRMLFFNRNPSGRILNRFARDINGIDSLLPNILHDSVDVSVMFAVLRSFFSR